MQDEGILKAEKNGVLLGINVVVQKKNKEVVKGERGDIAPRSRKRTEKCIT
jgi:hypothetical protein